MIIFWIFIGILALGLVVVLVEVERSKRHFEYLRGVKDGLDDAMRIIGAVDTKEKWIDPENNPYLLKPEEMDRLLKKSQP